MQFKEQLNKLSPDARSRYETLVSSGQDSAGAYADAQAYDERQYREWQRRGLNVGSTFGQDADEVGIRTYAMGPAPEVLGAPVPIPPPPDAVFDRHPLDTAINEFLASSKGSVLDASASFGGTFDRMGEQGGFRGAVGKTGFAVTGALSVAAEIGLPESELDVALSLAGGAAGALRGLGKLDGTMDDVGGFFGRLRQPSRYSYDSLDDFVRATNDPAPNAIYDFNDVSWHTDDLGRTSMVEGLWTNNPIGRNDPQLQRRIGYSGVDTDVGFHLWPDSVGGPTSLLNVVPGNGRPLGDGLPNLNQGEYARFEQQMRDLAGIPGNSLNVRIVPSYIDGNASRRPDFISVQYRLQGDDWSPTRIFENRHGG